jgi:hypothetical protein
MDASKRAYLYREIRERIDPCVPTSESGVTGTRSLASHVVQTNDARPITDP